MTDEEWATAQALLEARGMMSVWDHIYTLSNARCCVSTNAAAREAHPPTVIARHDTMETVLSMMRELDAREPA